MTRNRWLPRRLVGLAILVVLLVALALTYRTLIAPMPQAWGPLRSALPSPLQLSPLSTP